jgi:DNA mismatch endonuclease (patch repair protein)
MADIFSRAKRSEIMSRIRSRGTGPEQQLYALVRKILGWRRRVELNAPGLPGQPDVVIPSLRLAIFADGCFYHGCPRHGHVPKSNVAYWEPKIARTLERDRRNRSALRRQGYAVWRVWEHDLRTTILPRTAARLTRHLRSRPSRAAGH